MKTFFKNLFSQSAMKVFAFWGSAAGIGFSAGWSIQDGHLNLWPMVFVACVLLLIIIVGWLMRNNE